jgi:hypothetical protein
MESVWPISANDIATKGSRAPAKAVVDEGLGVSGSEKISQPRELNDVLS